MKEIDLHSLASANGKDLVEFIAQNSKVIGEVTAHISNLETLKGTSQAHALGYQEYLPEEVCIEDMSTMLSKKGYQISLESLASVLLVAASAAVVAGIGIIAYKLIKASGSKKPGGNANILDKQKQVQAMAMHIFRINFSATKQPTQEAMRARFMADCVKEATVGVSEADWLQKTYDIYLRSEMISSSTSLWVTQVVTRGEQAVLVYAASAYITAVKNSLEAFRRDFLDIIARAPDITDFQMEALLKDLKWEDASALGGGIQSLQTWAAANNLTVSSDAYQTLADASQTLIAPAPAQALATYDLTKQPLINVGDAPYDKFWGLLKSLKDTATYISGAKGKFAAGEKRSQQIVDQYKAQIDRAVKITDSISLIESLVKAEYASNAKLMHHIQRAGQKLLSAITDVADKLEDRDEAKEVMDSIKAIAKETSKLMTMKMESVEDRPMLGEMMILEGHNPLLEFMKVLGVAILIGLAVSALGSLIMSMLGIASFKAAWSGGLTYMDKTGRKITLSEGAKAIADKVKEKQLGQFAVEMLASGGKMPFRLDRSSISLGFTSVERGIKNALVTFSSGLQFSGSAEQISDALLRASEAGIKAVTSGAKSIEDRLVHMGFPAQKGNISDKESVNSLRGDLEEFKMKWFSGQGAKYDIIEKGINNSYWGLCDKDAPDQVEAFANQLTNDIKAFSTKVKTVNKETLAECTQSATEKHGEFIQALAYLAALGGVFNTLIREGMRQQIQAMACVRASIKMTGESDDGVEQSEEDITGAIHYDDPIDHVWDQLEGTMELESWAQADMVTENWKNAAKTGMIILGALALLGVGAYLLKQLSGSKRGTPANTDSFKKVETGQQAANSLDKMADAMSAAADAIKASADDAEKVVSTQGRSAAVADIGREKDITPPVNDTAKVTEKASVSGIVYELNSIVQHMQKARLEIFEQTYAERLGGVLRSTASGRMAWGMCMHGPAATFGYLIQSKNDMFGELMKVVNTATEEIIRPCLRLAVGGDQAVMVADEIYDKVVSEIEKITGNPKFSIAAMEAELKEMEGVSDQANARPNEDEIPGLLKQFKPDSLKNADVSYRKQYKEYDLQIKEVQDVLELAERGVGPNLKGKLEELRGQRTKASSLLLRIDEFRPTFTLIVKLLRQASNFGQELLDSTESTLRIHRRVQKEVADMVRKAERLAEQADRKLSDNEELLGMGGLPFKENIRRSKETIGKLRKEQEFLEDLLNEAGL